jgi:ribulose kinase
MHGTAVRPIQIWKPAPDFVEQSSEEIWNQCVESVRSALNQAGIAYPTILEAMTAMTAVASSMEPNAATAEYLLYRPTANTPLSFRYISRKGCSSSKFGSIPPNLALS